MPILFCQLGLASSAPGLLQYFLAFRAARVSPSSHGLTGYFHSPRNFRLIRSGVQQAHCFESALLQGVKVPSNYRGVPQARFDEASPHIVAIFCEAQQVRITAVGSIKKKQEPAGNLCTGAEVFSCNNRLAVMGGPLRRGRPPLLLC